MGPVIIAYLRDEHKNRTVRSVPTTRRPGSGAFQRPRRVAAFFDLDKTIIATSSVFAFNKSFLGEGLLSRRSILDLAYTQLAFSLSDADDEQMLKVRQAMATATKGWQPEQVERIVTEALTETVSPTVYSEAQELLAEHRAFGHDLVIVSASGEELVAPIARMLGVDHYAGTRMTRDSEGRYGGEIEFYCQGPGKAEALRAFADRYGYDLQSSYAYSDSSTDLPMLEEVGTPPSSTLTGCCVEKPWSAVGPSSPSRTRRRCCRPWSGPRGRLSAQRPSHWAWVWPRPRLPKPPAVRAESRPRPGSRPRPRLKPSSSVPPPSAVDSRTHPLGRRIIVGSDHRPGPRRPACSWHGDEDARTATEEKSRPPDLVTVIDNPEPTRRKEPERRHQPWVRASRHRRLSRTGDTADHRTPGTRSSRWNRSELAGRPECRPAIRVFQRPGSSWSPSAYWLPDAF